MRKDFQDFIVNYIVNLCFLFFILLISVIIISKVLDTVFGSNIIGITLDYYEPIFEYGGTLCLIVSVIQWIRNIVLLKRMNLDKETKSRWRHFMFLWSIFSNAEFYEQVGAGKNNARLKRIRDFLRLKAPSSFYP